MGPEAFIEKKAVERAKAKGGHTFKLTSPNNAGIPDRAFCHVNCGPFLVEFKAKGKRLSELQALVCKDLARHGWRVYANVDSVKMAWDIIDDEFSGARTRRHEPIDGCE